MAIDLTALSWGAAYNPLWGLRMENGLLVADGEPVGRQPGVALYTLSLEKVQVPG